MTPITDNMLSAYLDGELDAEEHAAVSLALKHDVQLQLRLRQFVQANAAYAAQYEPVVQAPMPDSLTALLDAHYPDGSATDTTSNVISFPYTMARLKPWAGALAAAACLVIGVFVGSQTRVTSPASTSDTGLMAGPVLPDSALHVVLSDVASGQSLGGITPVLTYAVEAGGYCREIETATALGLACKYRGEEWAVVLVTPNMRATPVMGYSLASGGSEAAFDEFANRLMIGAPLDAEAEAAALRQLADSPNE